MVFLHLRQRLDSIQALVLQQAELVSKQMVKWAGTIVDESIVLVEGVCQTPVEPIKSTTVSNIEILVQKVRSTYQVMGLGLTERVSP